MIHITTSQVKEFKNCRFKYWLSYRELLKPKSTPEALETGSNYHAKVEEILKTGTFTQTTDKTDAMAMAFMKYIYPLLPEVIDVERKFSVPLNDDVCLNGKIDAVGEECLIEHKTTKNYVDEKYIYRVNYFDKQVTNYILASGINQPVCYTVITKPTIRQRNNETLEEYLKRCEEWYDTDTLRKCAVFYTFRTDDELEKQRQELIEIAYEIDNCKNWYRNETACLNMNCPFAGICPSYTDSSDLVDFERKDFVNEELEEEL